MRKSATETQLSNIVVSLSDIQRERERASSPFGPVKAGLITLQITQRVQHLESPSYSVKQAKIIEFRYSEACVTLKLDTEKEEAVEPLLSTLDTTGTDVLE
jgi:hypothetical protein